MSAADGVVEHGEVRSRPSRRLPAVCRPLFAAAIAFTSACASPTLPLPPPGLPVISPGATVNYIRLSSPCGGVEDDSIVVVVNTNPTVPNDLAVSGARASACGAWDASVYAHTGDVLSITQRFGISESPPTRLQVQ